MNAIVRHVVVFVQENHTTDNYFRSMRAWGANVMADWPTTPNPQAADQPHDRAAYAKWLQAQRQGSRSPANHSQFDTASVLPYYAYLAATGAFLENHCSGYGTNSTPNHLLILGGQTPTLRNPARGHQPVWDMPSILGLADDNGVSWKAYTGRSRYPVSFYQQLVNSPHIAHSDDFVADAANPPRLAMVWHDSPYDEHPPSDVRQGQDKIWRAVDAIVNAGLWNDTVFLLTWDDWGGWDDHVATPNVEHTPDGVQLAYGPRVALLMFGGRIAPRVDSRWNSHVSIGKTVLDLLSLPKLGVDRLDNAPSLADLVSATASTPPPPSYGTAVTLPAPPSPIPAPAPPPPPPVATSSPVGPVTLRDGSTLPAPNDQPLARAAGSLPGQGHALRPPSLAGARDPSWPNFRGRASLVGTSPSGTVTVYVDATLGDPAQRNATDLRDDADRVVRANNQIFGTPGGPVSVIVFALNGATDGTGGADHAGCTFADGGAIEVCAAFGNSARVSALFEAELSECSMGGTLCGQSTGEALSRWCAAMTSNNALNDFSTAPTWAQQGMPDYVNRTDPTDQNPTSIGCGTAFISWLLANRHPLDNIAQAMVNLGSDATLADLYAHLSGDQPQHAWPAFQTAIQALPNGVRNDDPFDTHPWSTLKATD